MTFGRSSMLSLGDCAGPARARLIRSGRRPSPWTKVDTANPAQHWASKALSPVRPVSSKISSAVLMASASLPAWLAHTAWSIRMTARRPSSSPASSSARPSEAVQAAVGSPRNARYRARRRSSSARAGPA